MAQIEPMKPLFILLACLSLTATCPAATISRADIIKTVEHLQQRCHEAEAAQTAAQSHAQELQAKIDTLAKHDQAETAKGAQLAAENQTLSGRIDKLAFALAVAAGLLVWSVASQFAAILPPPYNLLGPIAAGVAAFAAVFSWIRYLL